MLAALRKWQRFPQNVRDNDAIASNDGDFKKTLDNAEIEALCESFYAVAESDPDLHRELCMAFRRDTGELVESRPLVGKHHSDIRTAWDEFIEDMDEHRGTVLLVRLSLRKFRLRRPKTSTWNDSNDACPEMQNSISIFHLNCTQN
jgi:hypothetical protein